MGIVLAMLFFGKFGSIYAAIFTVTSTANTGPGSLRQAVLDANASAGLDTITFAIPDSGVKVITLSSALPALTDPVVIDGTTQPGYAGTPLIEINGNNRNNLTAFRLAGGDSIIRGLAIYSWSTFGIHITTNGNCVIESCYIGTDATGTNSPFSTGNGLVIDNTAGNRIGGTAAGQRNLIARGGGTAGLLIGGPGASNNVVQGNFIGTDVTGLTILGNVEVTISNAPNNLIGGLVPEARNLIGGNSGGRVVIMGALATGNKIQGNHVGLKADGSAFFTQPGSGGGVLINDAPGNLVGGVEAGARNILAGTQAGVSILGTNATGNVVQGNFIGTDASGANKVPNHSGVTIALGASGNIIGGTANGAGNLISGNRTGGVKINNSSGNIVQGNLIGTDATGLKALGNGQEGVSVGATTTGSATGNLVGGDAAGARNVIAANGEDGVSISGLNTRSNKVQGNLIGVGVDGRTALGNGRRGVVTAGAPENLIGSTNSAAGNLIAHSALEGVWLAGLFGASGPVGTNNVVIGNTIRNNAGAGVTLLGANVISRCSIFDNGGLPIDRIGDGPTPNTPGGFANSPKLISAREGSIIIKGELENSRPNTRYRVEFFLNSVWVFLPIPGLDSPIGETTVTTDAQGHGPFEVTFDFSLEGVSTNCVSATATAIDGESETSEAAAPVPVARQAAKSEIQFQKDNYTITEGQEAALTFTRSGNVSSSSQVELGIASGTAQGGVDFQHAAGLISFAPGETEKTVRIPSFFDVFFEAEEDFYVFVKPPPTGGENIILGEVNSARVVIMDNNPGMPPSPKFNSIAAAGTEISVAWEGNAYVQCAHTVLGPWETLPGAGSPFMLEATDQQKFLRLVDKLCDGANNGLALQAGPMRSPANVQFTNCIPNGTIIGRLFEPDGRPAPSRVVRVGNSGRVTITKTDGTFILPKVPAGKVPVKVEQEITLTNSVTGGSERFIIEGTIEIDLKGNATVDLQLKVEIASLPSLPCDCTPWCAIIGGTVNGVQRVVASGGKSGFCLDSPEVKITGPGGVEVNFPAAPLPKRKRESFEPAANGTWTVTSTICGMTKTCQITLP